MMLTGSIHNSLCSSSLDSDIEMIDGLFFACDDKNQGTVAVSSIIDYLASNTNNGRGSDSASALSRLENILNPHDAVEKRINLETYRNGIRRWIEEVRNGIGNPSVEEMLGSPGRNSPRRKFYDSFRSSTSPLVDSLDLSRINLDYSVLETSDRIQEQELSEMFSKIKDLQHQNKKLVEDNSKLQQQLDVQEENVATMSLGNKALQKKLKSLQLIVEERNQTLVDHEELKSKLICSYQTKERLEDQIKSLDKENQCLKTEVKKTDNKIHLLSVELEEANIQKTELNTTLSHQKTVNMKLNEMKGFQESQLLEKNKKLEELETYIEKLHKTNEDIRGDKNDLQQELMEAQNQIYSLQNGNLKTNKSNSLLNDHDMSLIEGHITPSSCSLSTSTPLHTGSIHTELQRMIATSLHLPSPLSNKELAESIACLDNNSTADEFSSLLESCEKNGKNIVDETTKLVNRSKEKCEYFLREMDDLLNTPPELEKYKGDKSVDSNGSVIHKVRGSRNKKVQEVLNTLKAENQRLRCLHDEVVDHVINSEKDVDTSFDNRLLEEKKQRQKAELEVKSVQNSINEILKDLDEKTGELEALTIIKETLEIENKKLKRSNLDLAEKYHKSEIKTTELEEEIQRGESCQEKDRKKCTDLEESLVKSKLSRQLELRDIWRLVQKEIETECLDDQRDSPVSVSTDCLKDQISKDIQCLKDRLYKRQAALGALKGKQLLLPLKPSNQDGGDTVCYHLQDSPSSPLVDALSIDFFNGNFIKSGVKPASFSSFEANSLQRTNCEACFRNALSSNTSCPALHNTTADIYHHTASTSNRSTSHQNLNTSSSSSTSGVDISPHRTRSVHGQLKRRSFIRHSSRFKTDKPEVKKENNQSNISHRQETEHADCCLVMNNLQVDSPSVFRRSSYTLAIENQSDVSNVDNLQPITRDRSLSFQAAIEHGQKSPDSAMDLTHSLDTSDTSDYQDYRYDGYNIHGKIEVKSVSFDMRSEKECDEMEEFSTENALRSTPSPHRKLSILQEEEGENQNGNVHHFSSSPQCSEVKKRLDYLVEEDTMDTPPTNIVRDIEYDKRVGPITVGVTRDDLLAHMKNNTNNSENAKRFPPQPHSPNILNNNEDGGPKKKDSEGDRGHTVDQEDEVDSIATIPNIIPSRLSQLRQTNLAKKREQMKTMKLPELPETKEVTTKQLTNAKDSDDSLKPPHPSEEPVTPSIPDSYLKKLGLQIGKEQIDKENTHSDGLQENEIANKFNGLSLAYRTDRLTLDKRLEIQERARDISEQNVDQELHGLREAVEMLNRLCSDDQIREVIVKIKNHIDVLEQCAVRVSSRAEVLGAVQQERRMCRAMEIMIVHVENQKRLYEKDHSELQEARRILQDRPFGSVYGETNSDTATRRSMSVCAANGNPRLRRRSDVALPRILGGRGCPPLISSASLDPKQRFQSLVANATMKNAVTTVIRRASLDKQKTTAPSTPSVTKDNTKQKQVDVKEEVKIKQTSQEEEAYQKGFEDGVKMKISRELGQLRDQQNDVSSNLEKIMDKVEDTKREEEDDIKSNEQVREVIMTKIKLFFPNKKELGQRLRLTLAGIISLLALFTVVITLLPSTTTAMEIFTDVRHNGAPPQ